MIGLWLDEKRKIKESYVLFGSHILEMGLDVHIVLWGINICYSKT
jgi:hypothetical protein